MSLMGLMVIWFEGILQEKYRIPVPIGMDTVASFGTQDSVVGKVKEYFLRSSIHGKITGKETLASTSSFLSYARNEANQACNCL